MAQDGRIDVADQIIEVNGIGLENFDNDTAVNYLKEAVMAPG